MLSQKHPKAVQRSAVRIKVNKPKGKNRIKNQRLNIKENSITGSWTWSICMCNYQLLNHLTTVPIVFWWINFVMFKQFLASIDAVWSWWSCIYHEFKYSSLKSCPLDPMLSILVSKCEDLLPVLTKIVNNSLQSESFPKIWKEASVFPLLKKPGLCQWLSVIHLV